MGYDNLKRAAIQWDALQRSRIALDNIVKQWTRLNRPLDVWLTEQVALLKRVEAQYLGETRRAMSGEPWLEAVRAHVEETRGLGPAVFCVLGLTPPLPGFANPAKLWAYYGLAVNAEGRAFRHPQPPPPNNPRGPKGAHFSVRLRSYALTRIVGPIIRCGDSLYRALYDARKQHTLVTHPEWASENPKAPKLHYERDAQRYVAKRVWRDVWRVANDHLTTVSHVAVVGGGQADDVARNVFAAVTM